MCLKTSQEQEIIKQAQSIIDLLQNGRQKENLLKYEVIRHQGKYNMLDPRARQLTGLTEEDYFKIMKDYKKLVSKYPDIKPRATRELEYIKSAKISKIIAVKGCKNCIEIVSNKLDVKETDLCEECRKIVQLYLSSP